MTSTSPGYSITVRVEVPAGATATAALTSAVGSAGGALTALDVVESHTGRMVIDVTCDTAGETHAEQITKAIAEIPGAVVRKVSDRTFLLHLGGKIEVTPKVPLKHRDDLSRAYTPGVARVCLAIAEHPEDARHLTIKRNTVAVVTDGSAVLGLGNIGAAAALPVMEGKAALFKQFGGVDAWPVCLDTQDTDTLVEIVRALAPVYGGINLEDISAPRCFEIEARLRELLDIPVFHDDQHTNSANLVGSLKEVLVGADVFIGVSAPNLLTGEDIATMADDAIVFALANPVSEVDPVAASEYAAVVATGRSDYPNQINNVLIFPGFFRGLLDAGVSDITDEMLIAAAHAIADKVQPDQLNPSYIVPSVFDASVAPAVAAAVRAVSTSQG